MAGWRCLSEAHDKNQHALFVEEGAENHADQIPYQAGEEEVTNVVPFSQPPEDRSEPVVMMTLDQVFQVMTKQKTVADIAWEKRHQERLDELRPYSIPDLRRFWDNIGDDSFYTGPEGEFDCADIHAVMNEKGDGYYCAV